MSSSAQSGFSLFTRRRLLKFSLTAGGALLLGGGGLLALRGRAPAVAGLSCLSPHEYRTLSSLAEAILPRGGAFELGAADFDLARLFDGFLSTEPPWNVDDLKAALALLEFGPVVFDRRLTTFSNLSAPERLAHFEAWSSGDSELRRQAATAFRHFLFMVFYDQPKVWKHIGYDGPEYPVEEVTP